MLALDRKICFHPRMMESEPVSPLQNLLLKITRVELGRRLGISSQAISQWKKVPAERVADVEAITGVPREQIRPDIFRKSERVS
jgi:DNA-binding transcriptional regulator YdaS (Cro superfamily)